MNSTDYATHYESLPPYEQDFCIGLKSFEGLTTMRPHWHEHHEFVYITNGTGVFIINGERLSVDVGDLIVAAPNTLHALLSERGVDYYCLLIRPDFFAGDNIDTLSFKNCVKGDTAVGEMFVELEGEYANEATASDIMKKSIVYKLAAYLARNHRRSHLSKEDIEWRSAALTRMRKVEDFVSQNYQNKISTAHLSKIFYMSESHFCRLFKKTVGISPIDYINEYRVGKAELLLQKTDLPIITIAAEVGFEDANYFSRVFRKIKKLSPSEYRRRTE